MTARLILASASPARAELLKAAGFEFEVRAAPADVETAALAAARARGAAPEELALAAAKAKASAVAATAPAGAVVLGADTLVSTADGRVLGKGRDPAESCAILAALAGTRHRVISGVVLLAGGGDDAAYELVASSEVEMALMSAGEIDAYVASGGALGAAGAYRIQRRETDRYVRLVSGSFSNVVGLPLEEIIPALAELGVLPKAKERG